MLIVQKEPRCTTKSASAAIRTSAKQMLAFCGLHTLPKLKSVNCTSIYGMGARHLVRLNKHFSGKIISIVIHLCKWNPHSPLTPILAVSDSLLSLFILKHTILHIPCDGSPLLTLLTAQSTPILLKATKSSLRRPSESDKGEIETESLWLCVPVVSLQVKLIYGRERRRDVLALGTRRPSTTNRNPARAVFAEVASVDQAPPCAADNVDWKVIAQTVSCQLTNWLYPHDYRVVAFREES